MSDASSISHLFLSRTLSGEGLSRKLQTLSTQESRHAILSQGGVEVRVQALLDRAQQWATWGARGRPQPCLLYHKLRSLIPAAGALHLRSSCTIAC